MYEACQKKSKARPVRCPDIQIESSGKDTLVFETEHGVIQNLTMRQRCVCVRERERARARARERERETARTRTVVVQCVVLCVCAYLRVRACAGARDERAHNICINVCRHIALSTAVLSH